MDSIKELTFRELGTELVIYGILMFVYTLTVLSFLIDYVHNIYKADLLLYTFLALALILGQGVLMEGVSTYIREKIEER
ncbi:MAG: hypothetical protein B6U72_00060 [Candidatus Altiarchaeales archaeon ex4484_2]|nr:MAG: hypothetical protein B6U72_00060 [Candidatus Altiarchaeales archaeon ex4484_2]